MEGSHASLAVPLESAGATSSSGRRGTPQPIRAPSLEAGSSCLPRLQGEGRKEVKGAGSGDGSGAGVSPPAAESVSWPHASEEIWYINLPPVLLKSEYSRYSVLF